MTSRIRTREGTPGGLVELKKTTIPIIVGDLHSKLPHLIKILEHNDNLEDIKNKKSTLVLLGDIVHNDKTGYFREMESSLEIFEYVMELIAAYPENIVYLRGNHDTFDERLVKGGIAQGKEFMEYVLKERGEKYVESMEELFNKLPVFVIGPNYLITHAGPVRGGITREQLIHIDQDADKYHQLTWNRIHEFRATPNSKEYGEEDILKCREKLKMSEDSYFIVGHNPMWATGNCTGVWENVLGIKNHIILYSGDKTLAPYITFTKDVLKISFAIEKSKEALYV